MQLAWLFSALIFSNGVLEKKVTRALRARYLDWEEATIPETSNNMLMNKFFILKKFNAIQLFWVPFSIQILIFSISQEESFGASFGIGINPLE
jgi:hypothetical protein